MQVCTTCCKDQTAENSVGSTSTCTDREKCLSLSTELQQNTHTVAGAGSGVSECACVCESQNGVSDPVLQPIQAENTDQSPFTRPFTDITCCKVVQSGAKRGPVLQESLPGVLDHRTFSRVRVDPGRCEICGEERRRGCDEPHRSFC